jgi:hypothetical protein
VGEVMRLNRDARGVTMLELVMCLTLAAILMGSFTFLNRKSGAKEATSDSVGRENLRIALSEAVSRASRISMRSNGEVSISLTRGHKSFTIERHIQQTGRRGNVKQQIQIPIKFGHTIFFWELNQEDFIPIKLKNGRSNAGALIDKIVCKYGYFSPFRAKFYYGSTPDAGPPKYYIFVVDEFMRVKFAGEGK